MKQAKSAVAIAALFSATAALSSPAAFADSFNIKPGRPVTKPQTLNDGESGTVEPGGALSLPASDKHAAITVNGETAIHNLGTISTAGKGRAIDGGDNVSVSLDNQANGLIESTNDDVIKLHNGADAGVVDNNGTLRSGNKSTAGGQAIDFNDVATGNNVVNNHAGGIVEAYGSDAIRPGENGVINNAGTIRSFNVPGNSSGNDAIDAKTNTGVHVTNQDGGQIEGARHGITGGNTDTSTDGGYLLSVVNQTGGSIRGDAGSGINIDGFNGNELVNVDNGGLISGGSATADGDGVDVDGLVKLTNSGTIESRGAYQDDSEGVTVGGGSISNSGTIIGETQTNGASRGITLAGIDKDPNTGLPIPTEGIYADTTVDNTGLIRGATGAAIDVSGAGNGHTVTIDNHAGATLEGGGREAAVFTGGNDATITDQGRIIADGSGDAVDLGSGNSTLRILGGQAEVDGNISGGSGQSTLAIAPGNGATFTYAGDIDHFNQVRIGAGTTVLNGQGANVGAVLVDAGRLVVGSSAGGHARLSGDTVVANGAQLAGNGTVGATVVQQNATLAPGYGKNDVGTFGIAGSLGLDGTLALDITDANDYDAVNVAGETDFGARSQLALNLLSDNNLQVGDTLDVITAKGFQNLSNLELSGPFMAAGYRFGLADVAIQGRSDRALQLTVESAPARPVPEPSGAGLLAIALLLICGFRRHHRGSTNNSR